MELDNIIEKTNQKIGYTLYEREQEMKRKKIKKCIFIIAIAIFFSGATITVDALTNHAISEAFKTMIHINNTEYEADCKKAEDGSYRCKVQQKN